MAVFWLKVLLAINPRPCVRILIYEGFKQPILTLLSSRGFIADLTQAVVKPEIRIGLQFSRML